MDDLFINFSLLDSMTRQYHNSIYNLYRKVKIGLLIITIRETIRVKCSHYYTPKNNKDVKVLIAKNKVYLIIFENNGL